jgi:hypothetical protein
VTEDNNSEWKTTLLNCKIQGYPFNIFFEHFSMFTDFQKETWPEDDYENFMKAYSTVLTQIEKVQYELDQLDILKNRFEDVFKMKYKVDDC